MSTCDPDTLDALLDAVEAAAQDETASVEGVLAQFGDRSFTPFILVVALLMVTPFSGIPGAPTLSALIIITLSGQAILGRDRIWLPGFIRRRQIKASRLRTAVSWARRPARFVDRHAKRRLQVLTRDPMRRVNLALCLMLAMIWPALELLPFVTTIGGVTIALMAFGLFNRDGVYVLASYAMLALHVSLPIVVFT